MFTPMPRWAGWKEDSWGASHQGHSESKALELCHFSLHGGAACILGCGVSARESPGSEDQQRQPDRPLRPPAWLPGTVFTELHTGDRAGAERWDPLPHLLQGQEGVPYCQQSAAPARGEWRCRRDPAPRAPMRHKGTQIPETSLRAPRGSLLDSCLPREPGSPSPPQTCPQGPATAWAPCTVPTHVSVRISEKRP